MKGPVPRLHPPSWVLSGFSGPEVAGNGRRRDGLASNLQIYLGRYQASDLPNVRACE
jgi:hypothetical protein